MNHVHQAYKDREAKRSALLWGVEEALLEFADLAPQVSRSDLQGIAAATARTIVDNVTKGTLSTSTHYRGRQ